MSEISLVGSSKLVWRSEGSIVIKISRGIICIIAFSERNDDRIDALVGGILQIQLSIFLAYLSDQRPGCIPIDEKRSVVLVNKIPLVCTSF